MATATSFLTIVNGKYEERSIENANIFPSNTETITAQKNLSSSDTIIQYLTPSTADQILNFPDPTISLNLTFIIFNKNLGEFHRLLFYEDGVSVNFLLRRNQVVWCHCDGNDWNYKRW